MTMEIIKFLFLLAALLQIHLTYIAEAACNSVTIVNRSEWGAKDITSKANDLPKSEIPVKYLFIHHTDGNRCFNTPYCKLRVKSVENGHLQKPGWVDIGYNYLVGEDGNAYEGRGWRKEGAHTSTLYNNISVAISVLGNFVEDIPNESALTTIKNLIDCALDDGVLSPDYEMFGHRDVKATECPGQELYDKIKLWPKFSTRLLQKFDARPCMKYEDITQMKGNGIKTIKAGFKSVGKIASENILDQDIARLENYRECFVKVAQEYGIHPALIGALASRVSRGGFLTQDGFGQSDSSRYGVMQCDLDSPVYGSRCTDYKPDSCDHIQMMIDDKLVPDIRQARRKYKTKQNKWKAQRDAIAAYQHTVAEVQSWPTVDSGTEGGDFYNDVIVRARRLILHHEWTCDGTDPSPHLQGTSSPTPQHGVDVCGTLSDSGDCDFYTECVEKRIPCGNDGYAVGYGYRYCKRFANFSDRFTQEGKEWINAVRICLMRALLPHLSPLNTCKKLKDIAFDSHVDCYVWSGPGICSVALDNKQALWNVFEINKDFFGRDAYAAWKQVLLTALNCPARVAFDAVVFYLDLMKDISRQINAWEQNLIDRAIGNQGRRRKRSTECQEYAQLGDCRFYECFESKFACSDSDGYSHVRDFELTSCMQFQALALSNSKVSTWMTNTQKCLMNHLMSIYDQDTLDCEIVELEMMQVRVECMVDAGFCSLDTTDEWMIERATDSKGYPSTAPREYTLLPEKKEDIIIDDYYYQTLPWFKRQISLANKQCFENGERKNEELYRLVDTAQYGTLKIRNEL